MRHLIAAGKPASTRAKRLLDFQSQPFFVAEPWTALPGAFVALDVALEGYRVILGGDADTLSEQD